MKKFQTPRGMRDFLPQDMIRRQYVIDKIREILERWGYDPLETPAFEEWSLLAAKFGGGEAVKEEIYYFKDKSNRELGMRFDLTVPLARIVANNPDLPKPFKRYQIGPAWRYDRPGAGRWREFWQADVDIVGSLGCDADAEVLAIACEVFLALGFKDFSIRLNNRKILESFTKFLGIKNTKDVFRSIDKLEKIGEAAVIKELKDKEIDLRKIKKLIQFVCSDYDKLDMKMEGMDELEKIMDLMKNYGYEKYIVPDMSLVRGLDYYTGLVFEVVAKGASVSLAGGGRYDNLIEMLGGRPTPATGISFGIDRIAELIEREFPKTRTKAFIASAGDVRNEIIKISRELRDIGISNEYDLMNRSLQKQMEYTNSKGIPFVIVVGPKELESKKFKIRNMKTGEEKEFKNPEDVKKLLE